MSTKPDITIISTDNDKYFMTVGDNIGLTQYAYDTIEEVFEHILSLFSGKSLAQVGVKTATSKDKAKALKAWKYHEVK